MSYMTTNMFALHIWGFKSADQDMRIACEAGWAHADLAWERLMESANQNWVDGNRRQSAWLFWQADLMARIYFGKTDLRRATTAANRAIMEHTKGHHKQAVKYQRIATKIWLTASQSIVDMKVSPRSRSSLFHLRMETLHRDTFHNNMRLRFDRFAAETQETLRDLLNDKGTKHRHFSRWRGERPNVYDDTRKILGACLLIIDQSQT